MSLFINDAIQIVILMTTATGGVLIMVVFWLWFLGVGRFGDNYNVPFELNNGNSNSNSHSIENRHDKEMVEELVHHRKILQANRSEKISRELGNPFFKND